MSTTEFVAPESTAPSSTTSGSTAPVRRVLTGTAPLRRTAGRGRSGAEPAPDWRLSAACAERDLNTFFPISSVGAAARQQIEEAKSICGHCPVQTQCLAWALEVGPEFGIFGGRTEDERRSLRLQQRSSSRWPSRPVARPHRGEAAVTEALEPR